MTFAFLLLAIWVAVARLTRPSGLPSSWAWGRSWRRGSSCSRPWARASRGHDPDPEATRLRNLGTHTVYGVGLYGAAAAMSVLIP